MGLLAWVSTARAETSHAGVQNAIGVVLCLLGASYEECEDYANDGCDGADAEHDGAGVLDGIGMDGKVIDETDEEE